VGVLGCMRQGHENIAAFRMNRGTVYQGGGGGMVGIKLGPNIGLWRRGE